MVQKIQTNNFSYKDRSMPRQLTNYLLTEYKVVGNKRKKWVSYLYRTATTVDPCCVPTLGD